MTFRWPNARASLAGEKSSESGDSLIRIASTLCLHGGPSLRQGRGNWRLVPALKCFGSEKTRVTSTPSPEARISYDLQPNLKGGWECGLPGYPERGKEDLVKNSIISATPNTFPFLFFKLKTVIGDEGISSLGEYPVSM